MRETRPSTSASPHDDVWVRIPYGSAVPSDGSLGVYGADLVVTVGGGDPCAGAGSRRGHAARVVYQCGQKARTEMERVEEVRTCTTEMTVSTPFLCPDPRFAPAPVDIHRIRCWLEDTQITDEDAEKDEGMMDQEMAEVGEVETEARVAEVEAEVEEEQEKEEVVEEEEKQEEEMEVEGREL